jgi:hypothetical protein
VEEEFNGISTDCIRRTVSLPGYLIVDIELDPNQEYKILSYQEYLSWLKFVSSKDYNKLAQKEGLI